MTITNIISAIGNNRSIYPLLVRDCGIEVPSKIYITRKENLKESRQKANDATREKFIDEYVTSAVWLGGIPLTEKIADNVIKKSGYNPLVNVKLFKEEAFQGLEYNIKKFKQLVPEAVKDLEKIRANKNKYQRYTANKFIAAIMIPTALMGFVLPKLNFALTRIIKTKRNERQQTQFDTYRPSIEKFISDRKNKNISFGGNIMYSIASLKTVDKMALTDGGLTVGRVSTSRNKDEAYVNAFRMIGSMILNFVTPIYIQKGLDKLANKLFKVNVNLDPLFMEDKNFINAIKNNRIKLPKSDSEKDLFEFIEKNPKSLFSQFAQKSRIISYLENGVRDPRKYVDVKALRSFKKEFENFVNSAKKSKNVEVFSKKAKYIKGGNILANILISSTLLAVVLPEIQYKFNKLITGSYSDPGLR